MAVIKNMEAETYTCPNRPRHCPNPAHMPGMHLVAQIMSGCRLGSNNTNQTLWNTLQAFSVSFLFCREEVICCCVHHLHTIQSGFNTYHRQLWWYLGIANWPVSARTCNVRSWEFIQRMSLGTGFSWALEINSVLIFLGVFIIDPSHMHFRIWCLMSTYCSSVTDSVICSFIATK